MNDNYIIKEMIKHAINNSQENKAVISMPTYEIACEVEKIILSNYMSQILDYEITKDNNSFQITLLI